MPLLLGWRSSARGQSPRQRDTHGMAAAQLLLEEFERRQTRHSGSLGSFWWAVQREGTGRELGEPQGASSLLSGSSARELPAAAGAPLPRRGAAFPPSGCARSIPPPYPSSVPTHSSFSARELQKERRSSVRPRCPPARGQRRAPAQPCPGGKATGAGPSPGGQDRGASQALPPAVLPEQLLLPSPSGDQEGTRGCRTRKCPHPSLPPCCPLPAQALLGGQSPFPARRGHGWEALLPGRGTGHLDSPKSGNAGARGPAEDEGGTVLSAASFLLLLFFLPRRLLPAAQHPQLVQGQAELWAQAGATSAERRGRR